MDGTRGQPATDPFMQAPHALREPEGQGSDTRIYLVEDDPSILQFVQQALLRRPFRRPGADAAPRARAAQRLGADRPALICEPGRAMCGDAFTLAARVKAVRDGTHVFLNDGLYGSLFELGQIGIIDRITVLTPAGQRRKGAVHGRICFGPTCDSVDRLPGDLPFPDDIAEGDFVIFEGMGAYSTVTNSRFNGFGELGLVTVLGLQL